MRSDNGSDNLRGSGVLVRFFVVPCVCCVFFFQAEDGIRDRDVTGVQTCALPICAGVGGWAAFRGRLGRCDVADGRAALLRGGGGAGAGAVGRDEADVRAAGREGGARLRCDGGDRIAFRAGAGGGYALGGLVPDGERSAPRRGACCTECDEPVTRELPGDTMTRPTMRCTGWIWILGAAVLLTGCASGGARASRSVPGATVVPTAGVPGDTTAPGGAQVGAALAAVQRDSAADQSALDSLHGKETQSSPNSPNSTPPPPTGTAAPAPRPDTTVRGEEVQREAERLFGRDEAKTILGASDDAGPVF